MWRGGSFNNNRRNARSSYRNNNQPDEQNENLGFRLAGGCGTGLYGLLARVPPRDRWERAFPLPGRGPDAGSVRQTQTGPGLGLKLAARTALFGTALPRKKGKCLEDLFAQMPRIGVHGVPDPD